MAACGKNSKPEHSGFLLHVMKQLITISF